MVMTRLTIETCLGVRKESTAQDIVFSVPSMSARLPGPSLLRPASAFAVSSEATVA